MCRLTQAKPAARETHTGRGRGGEGRADPRGQSGRGPPPRIRSRPHLCSPYIPSQASQTRAPAKWPLGLCSLTIFSQAGEKIACQLGRGWPATGNRVGAPAPLTAGPGAQAAGRPLPLPAPPHGPPTGVPCPAIPPAIFSPAQRRGAWRQRATTQPTPRGALGRPLRPQGTGRQQTCHLLPSWAPGGCAHLCPLHLALLPRVGAHIRW